MTATLAHVSDANDSELDHIAQGPVIVASDGLPDCDEALRVASRLAEPTQAEVQVLSVMEPVVVLPMDFGVSLPYSEIEAAQRQARHLKIDAQLERVGLRNAGVTVNLELGDPSYTIARTARATDASLIVTGLGHHDILDRMLGAETALHIVRRSQCPVLCVPASDASNGLPRRIVVATDFSIASLAAARAALRLFPGITNVHLVHVIPRGDVPIEVYVTWVDTYAEPLSASFERFAARLDLPPSVTVETKRLEGKISREIVEYARHAGADLIVTGSRGAGLMNRLLVGSTATGIIRGADCAVLAVPAAPGSERILRSEDTDESARVAATWAEQLKKFTARNAGRRTTLEVDDPDFGVQLQEHGYPLLGVAYDHHDQRVAIMLGDMEGTRHHLSRGIANVKAVDVLRDTAGRDRLLRVAHGRGQTLLTFEN